MMVDMVIERGIVMNQELVNNITYLLVTAGLAGVAWIAKMIIKPWSDAALIRSQAFNVHVDKLGESIDSIVEDFRRHSDWLNSINVEAKMQTEMLKDMRAALNTMNMNQERICKAEEAIASSVSWPWPKN